MSPAIQAPLKVRGVVLAQCEDRRVTEMPADGVIIAIGIRRRPRSSPGQIEMKAGGYIKTAPHSNATSVAGVFAPCDETRRQSIARRYGRGQGCMAALEAEKILAAQGERAARRGEVAPTSRVEGLIPVGGECLKMDGTN
jgi:thioredoxin reductase (NADPH)